MSAALETYGDVGTVKAALKALILGPDFERALQHVEQRFADGRLLPRLAEHQVATTELDGMPPEFPFLELLAERSRPFDGDSDVDRYAHELALVFWVNGDDEQTVTALCERYALAARRTLRHASLMPMVANVPVRVGDEEYGVVGRRKELARPFIKAVALSCVVGTIDVL